MRFQSRSAFAYMFRNFWKLVYVALPVAVLMAFFVNPSNEADFARALANNELTMNRLFVDYARAVTVLRFFRYWWVALIVVLAFFVLCYTVSMLIVKINRHMHIGEMPVLPVKRAFSFMPVVMLTLACLVAGYEITMLLSAGIVYILKGLNNVIAVAVVGMSVNFVLHFLFAWVFMLLVLALPIKYSEHYHLNIAFAHSVRVMSKQTKFLLIGCFTYSLGRYAIMAAGYFLSPYHLDVVLYALTYLFVIIMLPCFAYKVYYDFVGGERRDIMQIMFE